MNIFQYKLAACSASEVFPLLVSHLGMNTISDMDIALVSAILHDDPSSDLAIFTGLCLPEDADPYKDDIYASWHTRVDVVPLPLPIVELVLTTKLDLNLGRKWKSVPKTDPYYILSLGFVHSLAHRAYIWRVR